MKIIRVFFFFFLIENFQFLEVKFSIYLNRRVFVMIAPARETNGNNLEMSFRTSLKCRFRVLIRIASI